MTETVLQDVDLLSGANTGIDSSLVTLHMYICIRIKLCPCFQGFAFNTDRFGLHDSVGKHLLERTKLGVSFPYYEFKLSVSP